MDDVIVFINYVRISLCGYDVIGYLYGSYPFLGMMLSKLRFDWWTSLRKQFGWLVFVLYNV